MLLADEHTDVTVLEAFRAAVRELGGAPTVTVMPARERSGGEPTPVAAAGFAGAGLVVELTTKFVQHSQARQEAQKQGLRYLFIGDIDAPMLIGPGAIDVDFEGTAPRITALARRIDHATDIRLTSPGGTDLTLRCEGRPGRALTGLARDDGTFGAPPCLEAGVIPLRGHGDGVVVVDRYCVGLGLISDPFRVVFEAGRVVAVEGSADAQRLERLLREAENPHAYDVCEVGIGYNDQALMIDNVTSAESVYGTAHVAIGTTPADPGIELVQGGVHIDMVFADPTITLDGEVVFADGRDLAVPA